jgi:ABC-type polysaccharide/polyol phosphate export permease
VSAERRTITIDGPPPALRFKRRVRPVLFMRELWRARELVRSLAERDLRARYKQAVLGFAWAVITPLLLTVVFTFVFGRVARIETGGVPYPLFAYLGLLTWTFFSSSLSQGASSLVANVTLLNKVYCPREVFPLGSVAVALVDMAVSAVVLGVMFVLFGFAPQPASVWLLVLIPIAIAFSIGSALALSVIVVYLRDLRHALPILLQLGLFATPVAYGMEFIPEAWRLPYVAVNPLAAVIDGSRRAVLLNQAPATSLTLTAAASCCFILIIGYVVFKRLETGIADVA